MSIAFRFIVVLMLALSLQIHAIMPAVSLSFSTGPCVANAVDDINGEAGKAVASSETTPSACKVIGSNPHGVSVGRVLDGDRMRFQRADNVIPPWTPTGLDKPPKSAATSF